MQDRTWALGLFLACLLLYWPTLSPSVVVGDGGEFQMVSHLLGVPHRTGYPLFVLLGWVVTRLPLGGDVAYRLTLLSMFSASAAMALFFLLCASWMCARAWLPSPPCFWHLRPVSGCMPPRLRFTHWPSFLLCWAAGCFCAGAGARHRSGLPLWCSGLA